LNARNGCVQSTSFRLHWHDASIALGHNERFLIDAKHPAWLHGTFLAAPLGFYIQYIQEPLGATRSFSIAAAMQATTWAFTTAVALAFILKGNVEQHRQWMTRSFAVALVFLERRVILGVTGWDRLGSAH
jgi:hypothetical protein